MSHLVITGGAGFIGSNFVNWLSREQPDLELVVVDLLTYAGNLANIEAVLDRVRFERADIADTDAMRGILDGAAGVINFAAESHVDRSLESAAPFLHSNVTGVQVLLDLVRELEIPRFLQIGTDEVYGSAPPDIRFSEADHLQPSSPYAASKAAADLLVGAAVHTWGVPALITRASNNYGPWQFPEKLIPLMITNIVEGRPLPVYGDGLQTREWLHVTDHCTAVWAVWTKGEPGRIYNVGTGNDVANLDLVKTLIGLLGASEDLITFVEDRPGHDRRYALDITRLTGELGWRPETPLAEGLEETIAWYRSHQAWWEQIKSGEYRDYYERMYSDRARLDG
jgi:dTDP-glucose 4,6-dehydratase